MVTAYTGPILMFEHCLDELKGWPDEAALDFDAFLSANVTVDPVYGGSVVHVNAAGEFELGLGPSNMGIFLLQGSHELDVQNPGGNNWTAIAPTGKMSGLVAAGGFELETTEFFQGDPTQNPTVHYTPGQQLTAPTEAMFPVGTGVDRSFAGKLGATAFWTAFPAPGTAVTNLTNGICAVVSRADHINHHRVPVLSFWPVYVPKCT
jgi:hypothetical protein